MAVNDSLVAFVRWPTFLHNESRSVVSEFQVVCGVSLASIENEVHRELFWSLTYARSNLPEHAVYRIM